MKVEARSVSLPFFQDVLPYEYYEAGWYGLSDGSVGQILEIFPPPIPLSPEGRQDLGQAVKGILMALPEGAVVQFIMVVDSDLRNEAQQYLSQIVPECDPFTRRVAEDKTQRMVRGDTIFSQGGYTFRPRRIRYFCTFRVWPPRVKLTSTDRISYLALRGKTLERKIQKGAAAQKKAAEMVKTALLNAFDVAGIGHHESSLEGLVSVLAPILSQNMGSRITEPNDAYVLLNGKQGICDYFVDSPVSLSPDGVKAGGRAFSVLYMKRMPTYEPLPGAFFLEQLMGGHPVTFMDFLGSFILTANVFVGSQTLEKARLAWRRRLAILQAGVGVEARRIKEDIEKVQEMLFSRGEKILNVVYSLVLPKDSVDRVMPLFQRIDLPMALEEIVADWLFLSSMPLGYDPTQDRFIKRNRKMPTSYVASVLPLYGYFRGTGTPTILFFNRRGQPVFIDLFDSQTAPHTVVMGITGAGKSVLVNDLLVQYRRKGARAVVVDMGDSYKILCELLGGLYVRTDMNNPLRINPLFGFDDPEDKETLVRVLGVLGVLMTGGKGELSRQEVSVLERVLVSVRKKKEGELFLSDLYKGLERTAQGEGSIGEGRDLAGGLAQGLYPYTKEGRFGRFFDGPNELDLSNPFVVYETGGLTDRELLTVFMVVILEATTHVMKSRAYLGVPKLLVLEEMWRPLSVAGIDSVMEEIARTYRKIGTALITVTQQPEEFLFSKAGKAILANSPNRFYLQQTRDVMARFKETLGLTDEEIDAVTFLVTKKGFYSEALFVSAKEWAGVVRLPLNPLIRWSTVTDPDDRAVILEALKRGETLESLVRRLAETG